MRVFESHEISNARRCRNVSQARLANLCGVTRNTISRLERGVTNSFELRYRISKMLSTIAPVRTVPVADIRGIT